MGDTLDAWVAFAEALADESRAMLGAAGVTAGLLFDHAFQHAVGEGDTGGLDGLNVVGSKKFAGGAVQKGFERAECDESAGVGKPLHEIRLFQKFGHGG